MINRCYFIPINDISVLLYFLLLSLVNYNMRKIRLFCFLFLMGGMYSFAQQSSSQRDDGRKGSYLSVALKAVGGGLDYKVYSSDLNEKGSRSNKLGYGLDLSYSYFFNNHWGVTSGLGVSRYASVGKLKGGIADDKYFALGTLTDDDHEDRPKEFELRTRISNLEEKQTIFFFEIPVMASYQTRFGEDEKWGLYGGLGVKLLLPISVKFKVQNGQASQFNVSGNYDGIPTDMGAPSLLPVPQRGYGTITDPNSTLDWNDKAKLKMGVAGTADLGFLVTLDENTDLTIGGYLDYGFTNLKKNGNQKLFTAPKQYHPGANNKIGEGIRYNGMLNSDMTGKIKPIAFGLKVGIRFKL